VWPCNICSLSVSRRAYPQMHVLMCIVHKWQALKKVPVSHAASGEKSLEIHLSCMWIVLSLPKPSESLQIICLTVLFLLESCVIPCSICHLAPKSFIYMFYIGSTMYLYMPMAPFPCLSIHYIPSPPSSPPWHAHREGLRQHL
jgi:hypothetical protein